MNEPIVPPARPAIPGRPVVLVVLDGLGNREARDGNAVRLARTPTLDALHAAYPSGELSASGLDVGLPEGQMGNSEVGHLNLGAGRVVYQDIARINKSITDGDFFETPALVDAVEKAKAARRPLHILGLTSPGGVHSALPHAYALVELAKRRGLKDVCWHAFLDGRDTPPRSAAGYLRDVQGELNRIGAGRIASIVGRYYAMDRDNRWDRVEKAYRLLRHGEGRFGSARDPASAVEQAYARGETDEFVAPIALAGQGPVITIRDGDAVVFFNFRSDRAREITRAFTQEQAPEGAKEHIGFDRGPLPGLSTFVCMTEYDARFTLPVAFAPQRLTHLLGGVIAERGLRQLRAAETEKYAHVTFFFNGGVETPFEGEERILVSSNREVATYDHDPAMRAAPVTDELVRAIESNQYAFLLVNYANPDMVGHTGLLPPTVQAVETVDACLDRIVEAARQTGAAVVITADHGNCEQMVDPATGQPHTAHTTNPVPLLVVDDRVKGRSVREGGKLSDVAPTVLRLMGLPQPAEMAGRALVELP